MKLYIHIEQDGTKTEALDLASLEDNTPENSVIVMLRDDDHEITNADIIDCLKHIISTLESAT